MFVVAAVWYTYTIMSGKSSNAPPVETVPAFDNIDSVEDFVRYLGPSTAQLGHTQQQYSAIGIVCFHANLVLLLTTL